MCRSCREKEILPCSKLSMWNILTWHNGLDEYLQWIAFNFIFFWVNNFSIAFSSPIQANEVMRKTGWVVDIREKLCYHFPFLWLYSRYLRGRLACHELIVTRRLMMVSDVKGHFSFPLSILTPDKFTEIFCGDFHALESFWVSV